jgi:hypothetical protein
LKTNWTPVRAVMSRNARASPRACDSLSMTQGPAMSASGEPAPIVSPAM